MQHLLLFWRICRHIDHDNCFTWCTCTTNQINAITVNSIAIYQLFKIFKTVNSLSIHQNPPFYDHIIFEVGNSYSDKTNEQEYMRNAMSNKRITYLKYFNGEPLYCWYSLRTKPQKKTKIKYSSIVGSTEEAMMQTRQWIAMKTTWLSLSFTNMTKGVVK